MMCNDMIENKTKPFTICINNCMYVPDMQYDLNATYVLQSINVSYVRIYVVAISNFQSKTS